MIWPIASITVSALIVLGTVYGCQDARRNYYAAQKACVDSGGSWVSTGSSESYNAHCIRFATAVR